MGIVRIAIVVVLAASHTLVAETPESAEVSMAEQMLQRNNELRASVGLPAHRLSAELTKAAQDHAEYMARTGAFSHYVNGGPSDRAARHGYQGSVRENIAMGYATVHAAFSGWQSSGGHWASIVSGTTDAGFGYAVSPGGTPYWVGVYGYPSQRVLKPVVNDETEADESEATATDDDEDASVTENESDSSNYYYGSSSRRRRVRIFGRRRR